MRIFGKMALLSGLLGALLAGGGCDDDDDKQPTGLATGVEPSRPLGMVTPAEATQICMASETWARARLADAKQRELTCKLTAVLASAGGGLLPGTGGAAGGAQATDAQLQMTCKTALDQCLAAPAPAPMAGANMCQAFPPSCTATVAEYEACLNDVPTFVDKTAPMLPSCETVNRFSALALLGLVNSLPMSCKTFQMKCGLAGIPGIPPVGVPQP